MPKNASVVQMYSYDSENKNGRNSHVWWNCYHSKNSYFEIMHTLFTLIDSLVNQKLIKETFI